VLKKWQQKKQPIGRLIDMDSTSGRITSREFGPVMGRVGLPAERG
jgi:hypothetical protein